ncbi:MAG: DegV family protein [Clostridia bacterium]|nr:DegV family protein [Clostridia bacterium]
MTAFFCDTNCEIRYDMAEKLGIKNIIQMPYTIDGKEYFYDLGKTYNAKEFFALLRAGKPAITSALNPEDYKFYFEPFFKNGEDIFYVSFSSEMSGTFKYMDMAVKELQTQYPGVKFTRYDTKGISMSAGISVIAAAKMFHAGKSVEEIGAYLDTLVPIVNASVVVDDLQHLKRGGRLSAAQAFFGGILKIKPIIKLTKKGTLAALDKVPGRNKALATVTDHIINDVTMLDQYPIVILQADCEEDANRVKAKINAALPEADVWIYAVGPVIGTHCGPGTVGICYVGKERPDAVSAS